MKGGDDVLTSDMESEVIVFTDLIQQTLGRALEFWQGDPISFKEKKTQGGSLCPKASELFRCRAEPRTDCPALQVSARHTAQMVKGPRQCVWSTTST